MKPVLKSLSIAACFTALMSIPALAQPVQVGTNVSVKGDVTITNSDEMSKQALVKDPVFLHDNVNTQKLSALGVMLEDETMFTVGPDCDIVIDEFVYDPDKAAKNKLKASVSKGMFRFISGKSSRLNPVETQINSPVSNMGIRGTILEGAVGPSAIRLAELSGLTMPSDLDSTGATLIVLRGPGANHQSTSSRGRVTVTAANQTVTLTSPSMATFVPHENSPPSDIFMISDAALELLRNQIGTKPTSSFSFAPFDLAFDNFDLPRRNTPIRDNPLDTDPHMDLDWPTEFEDDGFCNANNPNFPGCIIDDQPYDDPYQPGDDDT